MLESAAKYSCSTSDQKSTGLPTEVSAVIAWHSEATALETAKPQHMELTAARAVPARRSTRRPCGETSHSSQATRTAEQRREGQRRRGKLRLGRDLHDAGPARPRDRARQFPRHQSGWPMFFALMSSFFQRDRVHEICRRGDRHSSFPSRLGSVRSRCPPVHAIVRAVTATKHEPGLSPSYRVVSNGSALEVWSAPVRLSHCQRARSEGSAVVPL